MTTEQGFPIPQQMEPPTVEPPPAVDDIPDHTASDDFDYFRDKDANKPPEKPRISLGDNKARRGGPRQLTKKDLQQLEGLYAAVGMACMPFHQDGATAIAENAERCTAAWEELAKQNDSVRRALLAVLEGGAWGIVISAHIPIVYAFIPRHVMERMPLLFGTNGREEQQPEAEESVL